MQVNIKVAIIRSGRHQYEIARELGITENALSKFVRGHGQLPPEKVRALACLLDLEQEVVSEQLGQTP